MYRLSNMLASDNLITLFKMLPDGEWSVLKDDVPFGRVWISGEDYHWQPFEWDITYERDNYIVHACKTLEKAQQWVQENARKEPHTITDGITKVVCEWDTDHWNFN